MHAPLTDEEIAELRRGLQYARSGEDWTANDVLPRLLEEVTRSRALLKRIEYGSVTATDNAAWCCPCCKAEDPRNFQSSPPAHEADCELAALLEGR